MLFRRWVGFCTSAARFSATTPFLGNYKKHPDKNQEDLFFALLQECINDGTTEEMVQNEMLLDHVRKDAPRVLSKAPR